MKKIILAIALCCSMPMAFSQLNIELKSIKTDLKNNAVGFAINYLADYNNLSFYKNYKKGFVTFTPEVANEVGTSDAFSQVTAKLTGFFLFGKLVNIPGGPPKPSIDNRKIMHAFPFSVGAETNSDFRFLNSIFEFGYVPIYYLPGQTSTPKFLKYTQLSMFLQAGYKSKLDTASGTPVVGGKTDESAENLNSGLLRTKFVFTLNTGNLVKNSDVGFGLLGGVNYWYDIANSKSYYNLKGKFRFYLAKDKYFDLTYEKGSGAPNFNEGDQFGVGLSIAY